MDDAVNSIYLNNKYLMAAGKVQELQKQMENDVAEVKKIESGTFLPY